MATLFAIVYPNESVAKEAEATANGLDQAGFITLLDQVVVTKSADGKISHDGQNRPVRSVRSPESCLAESQVCSSRSRLSGLQQAPRWSVLRQALQAQRRRRFQRLPGQSQQ